MVPKVGFWLAAMASGWLSARVALAAPPLSAEGLVLVVNKQQPEGRALAEHYAAVRGVPDGRIIEVDVADGDEIDAAFYERAIADVVRREIDARRLRDKTQCVVLFYGVPLRVRVSEPTPAENAEVRTVLDPMIATLRGHLRSSIVQAETIAGRIDPAFKPKASTDDPEPLRQRGVAAEQAIVRALPRLDEATRQKVTAELNAARAMLTQMPAIQGMPTTRPTTMPTQEQLNQWLARPDDAQARRQLREAVFLSGNVFQLLVVAENQKVGLTGAETDASVDSELSCMFGGSYPRYRWIMNPWNASSDRPQLRDQVIRTARIDGPTPQIARRIIDNAIRVEQEGLDGDFVLDARGMKGAGERGSYESADESIRNVARFLTGNQKTIFDNNAGLLPNRSSDRAAVYVGWYSVRKYMPTANFVPGSVAWHVASYELVNLRSPAEQGWCRNLMMNGADVTIGPVSEPYLISFPPADEFLGLLFTGRTSVCEAYWASLPITSWKMILIGDPLYRPFAKRPIVLTEQLPEALRKGLPDAN